MKNLRKIAGISVLFTLVFMVTALFRFQHEGEFSILPQRVEYFYDEDWKTAVLDASKADLGKPDVLQSLIEDALDSGMFQKAELPYRGKSNPGDVVVFRNILPADYRGLTLNFFSRNTSVQVFLDSEQIYQYGVGEEGISEELGSEGI